MEPVDITAGSVVLTLGSTGNGLCATASDQTTLTISTCSGLFSSAISDEVKVYPSPATSLVHVEIKQGNNISEITVLNSLGQNAYANILETSGNTGTIDMSSLNAGMYFIRISNGQSLFVQKVIKE